ncbi:hypothetical protein V6N11_034721 [Hibiscus sabdariffa]|uniref:Uncharacterized protein n=1 Tax=Hibiscus sabdariffa TaxID=183260 RepID=A0ABR2NDX1_9ROSI
MAININLRKPLVSKISMGRFNVLNMNHSRLCALSVVDMDMLVIFALRKYVQMIFIKTTIMSPRILLHLLTRMALGCYLKRDGDVQTRNQNLLQGKISRYNPISVENEDRNTMATRLIHLPRHPWCLNLLRSHQRMPALMLRNPVAVASLQRT